MTFSIVARDPHRGDFGIAVQSKFLAVGAVVPWARAGVGAIATQSWANTSYGPRGLDLLASRISTKAVLDQLLETDAEQARRQVGIVGIEGPPVTYTGDECFPWAGGVTGADYACQGNILVGENTVLAMARAFEQSSGSLGARLLAALAAGQAAGGDRRGQQSAALLVVRPRGGYGGGSDRLIDLRVDDHPQPITELQHLFVLHELYFGQSNPQDLLTIDHTLATELQTLLTLSGDYRGSVSGAYNEGTRLALSAWMGRENLEERWREDASIDRVVLEFLRQNVQTPPR
ncbi:MAG: DUF1028 domain-containing protein [Ktedonobacteraceae bacterium]|nr:DUF1028 domain-containing protein [Ktedonobacteraceae bacterium]